MCVRARSVVFEKSTIQLLNTKAVFDSIYGRNFYFLSHETDRMIRMHAHRTRTCPG